jgi:hypothetical protein
MIKTGHFGWQEYFAPLMETIEGTDHYLVANDFQAYIDIQVTLPRDAGTLPVHVCAVGIPRFGERSCERFASFYMSSAVCCVYYCLRGRCFDL